MRFTELIRSGRSLLSAERGSTALEFGLAYPFLLVLLLPIADLGAYIFDYMELNLAVQAGAEYAARNGWNPSGIKSAMLSASPNLTISLITSGANAETDSSGNLDPAKVEFCGCASGTTITNFTQPCGTPRPTCPTTPATTAGVYVKLGAQATYHTITGLSYPFIPDNQTLVSWAQVRIQ